LVTVKFLILNEKQSLLPQTSLADTCSWLFYVGVLCSYTLSASRLIVTTKKWQNMFS